jgi:hypothetical protein
MLDNQRHELVRIPISTSFDEVFTPVDSRHDPASR